MTSRLTENLAILDAQLREDEEWGSAEQHGRTNSCTYRGTRVPTTLLTLLFLDIFVLLSPASASNQEEMLGSSEEALPRRMRARPKIVGMEFSD